jgi:conjugal transfer pilus assembly protein TraU
MIKQITLLLSSLFFSIAVFAKCEGSFVNPITDVCWDCFFPLSIGAGKIASGDPPDTENPKMPIELCQIANSPLYRLGINIGFWEPFALTDVTPTPYCMVNLGGFTVDIGNAGRGGRQEAAPEASSSFSYVHWYKYPLLIWLNILIAAGCMETGDFDIAYLTELDPTWNDDELAFILGPEAVLFSNLITQAACAADSAAAQISLPIDKLFWCMGTHGTVYPLTGTVFDDKSPVSSAVLLSERMDFKLHRQLMIQDSSADAANGFNGPICTQHLRPIMPKSRYRYQMTNTISAADKCYQFGFDTMRWQAGKIKPSSGGCYGFMIWKKRSCTFL